ncbi:MAG: hypothetical protein KDE20_17340 [Caldilineaceae bacterium]|nr:hypothetical protein [Caldilineaceae bacterium]
MFEQVQFISEGGETKFAVIPFAEFQTLQEILSDESKLADYLDYLHMQNVKKSDHGRHTLAEVKETLSYE